VNAWQEGSPEWQLLTSFHDMLEALKAEQELGEKEAQ
jgi:hypothetical protein